MERLEEFTLRISPTNNTVFMDTERNGLHSCKQLSMETLIQCIAGSIEKDTVRSGLLPQGCISFSRGKNGFTEVAVVLDAGHLDVTYLQSEYKNFPLPRLVFKFGYVEGGKVQKCYLGVAGTGLLRPDTQMYHYPFSNVSGYSLCTGNNSLPVCKAPHTLASLPYYILAMPNNSDHYKPTNNKLSLEQRDLMELLKGKDPHFYYSDILIPNGKTLSDFINC